MTFGTQLKMLRQEKGLTQAELGKKLDKGGSTVRMWELDKSSPDRKTLYQICELFNITPDYFFYSDISDADLKHALGVKNEIFGLIGKWTPYQAKKRLPVLKACQDLSEEELIEVTNYMKYLQTKRDRKEGGEGDK